MNVPRSDDRLDGLLFEVFSAETPRPDFSKWEQTHPEAVDELKRVACESAKIGSVNLLPLRIGAWIMSNRYARVTVMAAALVVVAVFVTWLCGDGVGPTRPAEEIAWNQIDTTPVLTESSSSAYISTSNPLESPQSSEAASNCFSHVSRSTTMSLPYTSRPRWCMREPCNR